MSASQGDGAVFGCCIDGPKDLGGRLGLVPRYLYSRLLV